MKKYIITLIREDGKKFNSVPVRRDEVEATAEAGMEFYEATGYTFHEYADPANGGCWFCSMKTEETLFFDSEFDTFVHESCLRKELQDHPDNPEAQIMSYLLEEGTE